MGRGNLKGCMSHGRHGRDPESVERYRGKQNAKYREDPEYRARVRALQGGRIHGIAAEEYTRLRSQPCAICGVLKVEPGKRGSGMHIDHDHRTGKIRGTLCDRCNRGIGMFDDSVEKLQAAVQYLCTTSRYVQTTAYGM